MEKEAAPAEFNEDYLFLGTGLTESILSASLATHQKKSINLEAAYSYSGTFCTLTMKELERLVKEPKEYPQKDEVQSEFKIEFHEEGVADIDQFIERYGFRGFNVDFNPRLIFSMGKATDLMIEAQIDNYISFRSLKGLYFADKLQGGKLESVPTDKGSIFKSKIFSLKEKKELFNFLNTAMRYHGRQVNKDAEQNSINDFKKNVYTEINTAIKEVTKNTELMKKDFVEFIKSAGVSSEKMIRLISSCMCNFRVNPLVAKKSKFEDHSTQSMLDRLTRFIDSMHVHGELPYLYPIYGTGDITQICSRISAVYASTFLLGTEFKVKKAEYSEEEGHALELDFANSEAKIKAKHIYVGPEYRSLGRKLFSGEPATPEGMDETDKHSVDDEFVRYCAYICKYEKQDYAEMGEDDNSDKPIFPLLCYLDIEPGTDDKVSSSHPITAMVVDHTCGTTTEKCLIIYFNYYKDQGSVVDEGYLLTQFASLLKDKFGRLSSIDPVMSVKHKQRYRSPTYEHLPHNVVLCPDTDFALDMEEMFIRAKTEALQGGDGKLFTREGEERGDDAGNDEEESQAEMDALVDLASFTI